MVEARFALNVLFPRAVTPNLVPKPIKHENEVTPTPGPKQAALHVVGDSRERWPKEGLTPWATGTT